MIFVSLSLEKFIIPCSYYAPFVPPHFLRTPNKSNLYLVNSLAAAVSEPALFRHLTFHVWNLMSIFVTSFVPKYQSRPESSVHISQQASFYGENLLSPRPTPNLGGPPLAGCPQLLIQYIRSYPLYWKLFFHPQQEDAPCHGERNPLITDRVHASVYINPFLLHDYRTLLHIGLTYSFGSRHIGK
jgi:hypothetical protein